MARTPDKILKRRRRKRSIRNKVFGTPERPRMSVFRSNKHIYVQVIDDVSGKTLASASTLSIKGDLPDLDKTAAAKKVGAIAAEKCVAAKIDKVVFDRNGYIYKGRIAALADAARAGGLKF